MARFSVLKTFLVIFAIQCHRCSSTYRQHLALSIAWWYVQIADPRILDKKWYLQIGDLKGVQKWCFRENSQKINSWLWLSAVNFHGRYNLRWRRFSDLNTPRRVVMMAWVPVGACTVANTCCHGSWLTDDLSLYSISLLTCSRPSLLTRTSWLQYITNVTPLIWVSICHHVTLSNTLTITLNLSPT